MTPTDAVTSVAGKTYNRTMLELKYKKGGATWDLLSIL